VVLQQLADSREQFDAWTRQLSQTLNSEEQQRLAWNVQFLDKPKSTLQLRHIQSQLSPGESTMNNTFKFWLWVSFYWQLRRSHLLNNDINNVLLSDFAWTLLRLQTDARWSSLQIQNIVYSFPIHLATVIANRWLCLKHAKNQLYLLTDDTLQFGANSICSLWQVQILETLPNWLRVENVCDVQAIWFINLQQSHSKTYFLANTPRDNSTFFCLRNGEGILYEQSQIFENSCQWQLSDCTHLESFFKTN
ncbi:hypothetical protein KR222_003023, partial [Zaprionus bogoriensis]